MPLPYLYSMQVLLLYFLCFIFCKFLLTQYIFFIVFKEIYIDTCSERMLYFLYSHCCAVLPRSMARKERLFTTEDIYAI